MDQNDRMLRRYTLDENERPSEGVYTVVATLVNCSPLDLTPLAEVTDPDALDALVTNDAAPIRVSFEYCGYEIAVTREEVRVREPEDE